MKIEGYSGDESERIDDVAKAQEMAEAGNYPRSRAAAARAEMEPRVGSGVTSTPGKEMVEGLERVSKFSDERADVYENEAGLAYEIKKEVENLGIEEIEKLLDAAVNGQKEAEAQTLEKRGAKARNKSDNQNEMERLQTEAAESERRWRNLTIRVSTLNEVLVERQRNGSTS